MRQITVSGKSIPVFNLEILKTGMFVTYETRSELKQVLSQLNPLEAVYITIPRFDDINDYVSKMLFYCGRLMGKRFTRRKFEGGWFIICLGELT